MKLFTILLLCAVAVGCGYGSSSTTTPGVTPNIVSFNPASSNSTGAGGGAFSLQVIGANFSPQAYVTFNNARMTTTVNSTGQVTVAIPQSAVPASAATVMVTVTNPGTGGIYGTAAVTSQVKNFQFN